MSEVQQNIRKIILNVCHPSAPDLSDTNRSLLELGLDSLDFSSVLMAIEDEYKVPLVDQDVSKLLSISQLENYLKQDQN